MKFGCDPDVSHLLDLAGGIKTYSERLEDDGALTSWKLRTEQAQKIVFLGFSYIEQNMKLLTPEAASEARHVYATAYGLSDSNAQQAKRDILSMLGPAPHRNVTDVHILGEKCVDFLYHYSMSITR